MTKFQNFQGKFENKLWNYDDNSLQSLSTNCSKKRKFDTFLSGDEDFWKENNEQMLQNSKICNKNDKIGTPFFDPQDSYLVVEDAKNKEFYKKFDIYESENGQRSTIYLFNSQKQQYQYFPIYKECDIYIYDQQQEFLEKTVDDDPVMDDDNQSTSSIVANGYRKNFRNLLNRINESKEEGQEYCVTEELDNLIDYQQTIFQNEEYD